jgi:hypothetical protein
MSKLASPTNPNAVAGHGVLRNQIIVSIGPLVFAVEYAVRITELKGVPRDGSGRIISMTKAAKPSSEKPHPSA